MKDYFKRRKEIKEYMRTLEYLDKYLPNDTELRKRFIGDMYDCTPRWLKSVVGASYVVEDYPDGRSRMVFVKHTLKENLQIVKIMEEK